MFVCLSVCLFACLFVCLLVCLFACLSVCLFACLSVCFGGWITRSLTAWIIIRFRNYGWNYNNLRSQANFAELSWVVLVEVGDQVDEYKGLQCFVVDASLQCLLFQSLEYRKVFFLWPPFWGGLLLLLLLLEEEEWLCYVTCGHASVVLVCGFYGFLKIEELWHYEYFFLIFLIVLY